MIHRVFMFYKSTYWMGLIEKLHIVYVTFDVYNYN